MKDDQIVFLFCKVEKWKRIKIKRENKNYEIMDDLTII